jgi:4-carboxymuconolactone decarboxylase
VTENDRHTKGLDVMKRLSGGDSTALHAEITSLDDVAPDLSSFVIDFCFGEIYSRPGLEPQRRHLVTLASLITLGGCDTELRVHVGLALNLGVTPQEIVETALHVCVYAGFGRGVSAIRIIRNVFQERGITSVD